MGHLELSADVARSHAHFGHFDDASARNVGQRASVDEVSAKLIHLAVGLLAGGGSGRSGRGCGSRLVLARIVQMIVMLEHGARLGGGAVWQVGSGWLI